MRAPFDRFEGFFRPFGLRPRWDETFWSFRDFFPDAFAYNGHKLWNVAEHEDAYFALFERELAALVQPRLGTEVRMDRRAPVPPRP